VPWQRDDSDGDSSGGTPMGEAIVDTSVIIDFLRGRVEAKKLLENLQAANELATHTVVVAETLSGARDLRDQREIERFFRRFRVHAISAADADVSLDLLRQYRLSRGVGFLDCLIAATCLRLGLPVITLNDKHFAAFDGLTAHRPYRPAKAQRGMRSPKRE